MPDKQFFLHEAQTEEYLIKVVTATQKGYHHGVLGVENQDYVLFKQGKNCYGLAIADGVGSKANASEASRYAITAFEHLINYADCHPEILDDDNTLTDFVKERWDLLCKSFANSATTLHFLIIHRETILFWSIGDGIVLYDKKMDVLRNNVKEFSNVTTALSNTITEIKPAIYRFLLEEQNTVALFTDGIADILIETRYSELIEYFKNRLLSAEPNELKNEIEGWFDKLTESSGDDMTLAILYCVKKG